MSDQRTAAGYSLAVMIVFLVCFLIGSWGVGERKRNVISSTQYSQTPMAENEGVSTSLRTLAQQRLSNNGPVQDQLKYIQYTKQSITEMMLGEIDDNAEANTFLMSLVRSDIGEIESMFESFRLYMKEPQKYSPYRVRDMLPLVCYRWGQLSPERALRGVDSLQNVLSSHSRACLMSYVAASMADVDPDKAYALIRQATAISQADDISGSFPATIDSFYDARDVFFHAYVRTDFPEVVKIASDRDNPLYEGAWDALVDYLVMSEFKSGKPHQLFVNLEDKDMAYALREHVNDDIADFQEERRRIEAVLTPQ